VPVIFVTATTNTQLRAFDVSTPSTLSIEKPIGQSALSGTERAKKNRLGEKENAVPARNSPLTARPPKKFRNVW